MQLVRQRLVALPDDIVVKGYIEDSDLSKKVEFILESYDDLKDNVVLSLPFIREKTTLGEIKDNLDKAMEQYPDEILDFLREYKDEFYPNKIKSLLMFNKMKLIILLVVGSILVIFALTLLLYGVITGTWDVNAIGSYIWNGLVNLFSNTLLGGSPDPGHY